MAERTSWGKRLLVAAAVVLGLPAAAAAVTLEMWQAEGPAMEPTLAPGERFVATRFALGEPEPGDIVVFEQPDGDVTMVKRVVAIGGQTVEIRGGAPVVDGESLRQGDAPCPEGHEFLSPSPDLQCFRESVGDHGWLAASSPMPMDEPEITVPEGHVYVLGDRRERSNDSRNLGPIPTDTLTGTVILH